MSSAQDRIVTAALLLSESAWLAVVFGMIGLGLGGGGSPLGWLAVLAIASASLLVARGLQLTATPNLTAYAIQGLAGVVVVYLTVGSQVASGFQGLDVGWIFKVMSGTEVEGFTFRVILGSILGAGLWWRGGHLGAVDYPADSLATSFKLGLMALAVAALVDIVHTADLNVYPLMFVFFAAGLVGLSVGHILPASERAVEGRAWPRVIGGVVSVIIVAGLLFSLLQRNALTWLSGPLAVVLNALATVIFYIFIAPLALIVDFLTRIVLGFLLRFLGGEKQPVTEPLGGIGDLLRGLRQNPTEQPVAATFLHVLEWTILAIIVLVALYFLARAFQRRFRWRRRQEEGVRESIAEEADPAYDLAKLLFNLIPARFKRMKQRRAFRLPDDPSVVDVFRVYYDLLMLAEDKGFPKPPADTPTEYQRTLEEVFPQELARKATAAFVRACYGHHPATREQIAEMRAALEQAGAQGR